MNFFSNDFSIRAYVDGVRNRQFSVSEAVEAFLSRISSLNPDINAFLDTYEADSLKEAEAFDRGESNPSLPLAGVPVAIKDNMLMRGKRTTAASRILEKYTASYDATVVSKLKNAGALIVGKTNLDEFAMGSSSETSAFGPVKNPLDTSRVPGGSSGGSAAAVAANMVLGSLGSDTGGSIRQPASFCGVVGLKPTYGSVSRYGLMALASSLDQIGPFGKTVEDVAVLFDVIAGKDPLDATSVDRSWATSLSLGRPFERKPVIGIPRDFFAQGIDEMVARSVEGAIDSFGRDGFEVKEIQLPHASYAVSCYYIILPAECSSNLARYDGIRYARLDDAVSVDSSLRDAYLDQRHAGFGDEPKRRMLLGAFVLSSGYYDAYYAKAQKVRRLIFNDFQNVFDASKGGVDAIVAPVTPTPAFSLGEKINDPLAMYLSDIFTIPVNLAGLPSLSLPVKRSWDSGELPIGFQIIGNHFSEESILSLGHYYQTYLSD